MNYNCMIKLYNNMVAQQERTKITDFLKGLVNEFEKFNDPAEDYKTVINILESEDWALGK